MSASFIKMPIQAGLVLALAEIPFIQKVFTYAIVEGPTWEQAQANAEKLGGNLVTINDSGENEFLYINLVQPLGKVFGLASDKAQEGSWKWTDGSDLSFTNWQPNEPNNNTGGGAHGEDYLQFVHGWDSAME